MNRENNRNPSPFVHLICGGIAGSVAKTVVGPFDRVKILFQVQKPEIAEFSGKISGVFRAIAHIYRRDGLYGLYRGHSATLFRIFPYAGINFMAYEKYKSKIPFILSICGIELLTRNNPENPFYRLVAGSMAGATSVFVTYPLDIIRARLAYQMSRPVLSKTTSNSRLKTIYFGQNGNGTLDSWKQVLEKLLHPSRESHGGDLGKIYRGFLPSVAGIIPYAGVSFCTFETLKTALTKYRKDEHLAVPLKFISGWIAGILGQTVSYPLDVVRRRMQLDTVVTHYPVYPSIWSALCDIYKTQGFRGLYVGISINYLKVAPATAISFVTYEFLKERLQ